MASYTVNPAGVEHTRRLIAGRQYVLDSEWGDVQPAAADETAYLEAHGWDDYAGWFLGLTDGANDETKGRYAFVCGDIVYRGTITGCSTASHRSGCDASRNTTFRNGALLLRYRTD